MKRFLLIALALCMALAVFSACAKKDQEPEQTTEDPYLKWKEIADAELADKGIENLEKYRTTYNDLDGGGCSVMYTYYLHGHETEEAFLVNILKDGTVDGVLEKERGKYTAFEGLTDKDAIDTAYEKVMKQAKDSKQEGTTSYYLIVDEEGFLCAQAEIYVYLDVETDAEGNELEGCGVDHDHILFTETICAPAEAK